MASLKDLIVTGPARIVGTLYAQNASTSTAGLVKLGGGTANFLRADGTWAAPPNTTYSANNGVSLSGTTFSNSGVRSIATGGTNGTISVNTNGTSAEVAVKGLGSAAYTASTAYATSGHTHATSIATSSGTNQITLAANTKYAITAGGTSYVFTTPPDNNTTYSANTGIKLNGTTFQHTNAVTAGTAGTSSATSGSTLAVPYVTYDAQGHVTGSGTHTHTVSGFLTSSSSLDATKLTGIVPTANLPSYVDEIREGYLYNGKFYKESAHTTEITAEADKIYVELSTNKTYRYGGSAYVEISPSLAIGTTASTAAKGNHTHSVTAAGSVSQPSFTGTAATISVSKSYTPAGSVAAPTFTGTKASGLTVSPASSGTATYTPEGTVSQPTFTGTAATISVSKSYTPAGSVSTPTISVKTAGSTTTVNSITAVGTLPSLTVTNQTVVTGTSVSGEVMSFTTATNGSASGWSAGTLPTKGSNTTVKTGDAAYQSSQPTFTGTAATITSTGSYTPAGTVSQPTFTGTGKRLVLQDYTPAGTNSAPAFTGTAATITSTGSYTPAGTVSKPSFTGSAVNTGVPA